MTNAQHTQPDAYERDRVEAVAIAIGPWENGSKDDRSPQEIWDDMFERFKAAYRAQARAAIAADEEWRRANGYAGDVPARKDGVESGSQTSPAPTPADDCRKAFERDSGLEWNQEGAEYAREHFVGGWQACWSARSVAVAELVEALELLLADYGFHHKSVSQKARAVLAKHVGGAS